MRILLTKLFLIFLSLHLSGCAQSVDEKKITNNINEMRAAIQNHDRNVFMKHVAPRYRGQRHGNRAGLERFVIQQLNQNKFIYIHLADISIEISSGIARVIFYAGTAGGPNQIPEHGKLFKVTTNWKEFEGYWQLTNAKWRPALTLPVTK